MEQNTWDESTGPPGAWEQALGTIFALASAARHHPHPTRHLWDVILRARGIQRPVRKAFWLRLMQSAALIDSLPGGEYRPTALFSEWLSRPAARKANDLIEAWVRMPASLRARQDRRRIIRKLTLLAQRTPLARPGHPFGPQPLTSSDLRQISALRLLGIWDGENALSTGGLSAFGHAALSTERGGGSAVISDSNGSPAWEIALFGLQLCQETTGTQNLPLLWDLEAFLQPYAPGRYLLTPPALRLAAQRGSPADLADLLERGSEGPLSPEMRARILDLPQARMLTGAVLEFDSTSELAQLRQRPAMRQKLDRLLSPRHVYLPPYAQAGVLQVLARAGIPIRAPALPAEEGNPAPSALAPGEIADLLALALAAQQMDLGIGVSEELIEKLSGLLPPALLRAARKQADHAVEERQPAAPYSPPAEPGTVPPDRLSALQCAAEREEALSVWYSPAGAVRPERRRITPLLIEQRGLGLYLIAYCHQRRASRTFRLDRLLIDDEMANDHGPAP